MGISEKVSQLASNVQTGVKNTSVSAFALFLKVLTGFFLGLTLALIGQVMMGYGTFAFVFVMVTVLAVVMKILSPWGAGAVLLFDLFCVLVALVLRMYILLAP